MDLLEALLFAILTPITSYIISKLTPRVMYDPGPEFDWKGLFTGLIVATVVWFILWR